MLKIEHSKIEDKTSFNIRHKTPFFDYTLIRALLISACVHLFFVTIFRVKMFEFEESAPYHLVSVALDPEGIDAAHAIVDQEEALHSFFLTDEIETDDWNTICLKHAQTRIKPQNKLSDLSTERKALFSPIRYYPLKIKLGSTLKSLKIVEDGSSLFKEKNSTFTLPATNHYIIEYHVDINRKSGTILHYHRKKELLDKLLQDIADQIITSIRFAKSDGQALKGTITLDFFYDGEKLQSFLEHKK